MATMLDHSVGYAVESTFGTAVSVSRFQEFYPGNTLAWDPGVKTTAGLRAGSRYARSNRRIAVIGTASGSLKFDLMSKGLGTMLQACAGVASSTLVSGTTFQQLFTGVTGSVMPSLTIQEGIVKKGSGAVQPLTFAGCSVTSFSIAQPTADFATLTANFDGASITRATGYVTPTYVTGGSLFSFAAGSTTLGGTLTAPTATALASVTGGTSAAIRSWQLDVDNGLDLDGYRIGSRSQPAVGAGSAKLKCDIEFDSTTGDLLHDAFVAQTSIPIVLTATTTEALSTGTATFQVVIPEAKINSGGVPQPTDGKTVVQSVEFEVLDGLTFPEEWYLVMRTSDSAL